MTLAISHVSVLFGDKVAVSDVSLTVLEGQIIGLLGPSGCGKSTLLRAVSALVPMASGVISWAGEDLSSVPVHKRGFGFVFQDGQLFAHKSVSGNVEYGLSKSNFSRVERKARVSELLRLVGLTGYEDRNVTTLSGGEKQRVALARALAPAPRVLLLDEPLSALDRELRERLALDLREILRATGTTAIFVTHDQDEAFTVCDSVAVMRSGAILQVDKPERLWRKPVSTEVAEFLGYEYVAQEHPFEGFAPGDFEVVETMTVREAQVLAERFGQLEPLSGRETRRGDLTELAGVVVDKHFQSGRAVVRVKVPGLAVLTATVGVTEVAQGQGVRLLKL